MEVGNKKLELYFHIPFCVRKCNYCDFLSFPADREVQEAYMAALFSETRERAAEYQEYEVVSVFIGGGTPSVVKADRIAELLQLVKDMYRLAENAEITIEVNPGTVNEEMLSVYRNGGINRLSIGLQSANDGELHRLGRIHTFAQFLETYNGARNVGFQNINVDVMSALPGQDASSYRETLGKVLALKPQPEHISAYSLIVEEGTPFAQWEAEGTLDVVDEDTERDMYEDTKRILEKAGYARYEISNYAKSGYACRHNVGYWKRQNYVGFGIGAASCVENVRFHNCSELSEYLKEPMHCRVEQYKLDEMEQMEEFMFLGLRMTEGVSEKEFAECFHKSMTEVYGDVIGENVEAGLLCYRGEELALTEKGLDVSNYVMAQFLFDKT